MKELVSIKSNLTQKMNRLDLFSNELPNKISCIPEFFIDESDLYNQLSKSYFHRINYKASVDLAPRTALPKCSEFVPLDFSVGLFEHLEAMRKRHKLRMQPEDSFGSKELGKSATLRVREQLIFTHATVFQAFQPRTFLTCCTRRLEAIQTPGSSTCWAPSTGDLRATQRRRLVSAQGFSNEKFLFILSIDSCLISFRMRSSSDTLSTSKIQR